MAVIASLVDWASAFDRQDATKAIEKFIKMGVRPAVIPVLVSYLSDRQMQVRYNDRYSGTHKLPVGVSGYSPGSYQILCIDQ